MSTQCADLYLRMRAFGLRHEFTLRQRERDRERHGEMEKQLQQDGEDAAFHSLCHVSSFDFSLDRTSTVTRSKLIFLPDEL